jgi:hypothetical protein
MEKFDPTNPEYKQVKDLPQEEQGNYIDIPEGGFITKEAHQNDRKLKDQAKEENGKIPFSERIITKKFPGLGYLLFGKDRTTDPIDLAHEEALKEDHGRQIERVWEASPFAQFIENPELDKKIDELQQLLVSVRVNTTYDPHPKGLEQAWQKVREFEMQEDMNKIRLYLEVYIDNVDRLKKYADRMPGDPYQSDDDLLLTLVISQKHGLSRWNVAQYLKGLWQQKPIT